MSSAKKTALLIDGNAMIHRAWHALPPMTGPDGEATSAVYGFASILLKLLPSVHPDYLAVCWDTEAPTYRHEANAAYKAQRVEQPQEFYDQFDGAKEMVEIFGGVNLEKDGYEADDLIATLATRLSKHGVEVAILSSDRDLWQLISPHVHILSFVKGVSETTR
jgi:DNA polymerase-1